MRNRIAQEGWGWKRITKLIDRLNACKHWNSQIDCEMADEKRYAVRADDIQEKEVVMITRKRKFGKASTTDFLLMRERLGLQKYRKTSKRDPDKNKMLLELALKKIEKTERSNFISIGYRKRRVKFLA